MSKEWLLLAGSFGLYELPKSLRKEGRGPSCRLLYVCGLVLGNLAKGDQHTSTFRLDHSRERLLLYNTIDRKAGLLDIPSHFTDSWQSCVLQASLTLLLGDVFPVHGHSATYG